MNHVLLLENLLSETECQKIINESKDKLIKTSLNTDWSYEYYDMANNNLTHFISKKVIETYTQNFPEINLTADPWLCKEFRFKHFPPGYSFDKWHSEHTKEYPYRIACIILYLSNHDCGTEFYDGTVVKSNAGSAIMFPTSWTHTHRGQMCPLRKSRYIMSAYVHLVN
jgi:hypothetical protein